MTQEILTLIQQEVDGLNTPEEQSILQAHCAEDPATKLELEGALMVGRVLNDIADVAPPRDFVSNVMKSLPMQPSWQRAAKPAPNRSPIFRFPSRPVFTLAYGLAIGVFVTIFTMSSLEESGSIVPEQISGTLAPAEQPADANLLFAEEFTTDQGETIFVEAIRIEEGVQITTQGSLAAEDSITLTIDKDGSEVFRRTIPTDSQ